MIRKTPTLLAAALVATLSACDPASNTDTAGAMPADTPANDTAAAPPPTDTAPATDGTVTPTTTAPTTTQGDASAAAGTTSTTTPGTPVMLNCSDNTRLSVTYSDQPDQATVAVNGGAPVTLAGQRPASGVWFAGNGYELRGKGTDITWTTPGATAITCTQASAP